MSRKRTKKRKLLPALTIVTLVIICLVGFVVYENIQRQKPSDERVGVVDIFPAVRGEDVLIYEDYTLSDIRGVMNGSLIYVPFDWVYNNINNTFYYEEATGELLYSDAYSVFPMNPENIIKKNGQLYIAWNLVKQRSDIISLEYTNDEVKRIFIDVARQPQTKASLTTQEVLRTEPTVKSPGICDVDMQEMVTVLSEVPADKDDRHAVDWSYVITGSGLFGYVRSEFLTGHKSVPCKNTYTQPQYPHILMSEPVLLAWHQVTNVSSNNYIKDLMAHTQGINVLSPTWFSVLDTDGNINSLASHDYVNFAHDNGIKVWALIDNFSFDIDTEALLKNPSGRKNLISNLVSLAKAYNVDGINVDFELIPQTAGRAYAQFIRELSVACRKEALVLSVDDPAAAVFSLYYQRDTQAQVADYVINMGYDEHYAGGEAGSVASYPFVKESLELCLTQVPSDQLINGLPFYTRIWTENAGGTDSKAVGLGEAMQWVTDNNVELNWNSDLGQYVGSKELNGSLCSIWLEENESMSLKAKLTEELQLAGAAAWKLGLDSPEIWGVLQY